MVPPMAPTTGSLSGAGTALFWYETASHRLSVMVRFASGTWPVFVTSIRYEYASPSDASSTLAVFTMPPSGTAQSTSTEVSAPDSPHSLLATALASNETFWPSVHAGITTVTQYSRDSPEGTATNVVS